MSIKRILAAAFILTAMSLGLRAQQFTLNEKGYFSTGGVDAMLFSDYYPEVTIPTANIRRTVGKIE